MSTEISFEQALTALLDSAKPVPAHYLHRFSDLTPTEALALNNNWEKISPDRVFGWLEDLEELADSDSVLSFFEVGRLALTDAQARVRELGIRLLWEDEAENLIPELLRLLTTDPDVAVQAAAASLLGRFIFLGEMEEIPAHKQADIETALITRFDSRFPLILRRRVIEALGYSSNPAVPELIKAAYSEKETAMRAAALFAMGRSANEDWQMTVLDNMDSPHPEMRLEAVRAAGELELADAREPLLDLLDDENLDDELLVAVAWSLSQIGGEQVQEKLSELAENPDIDEDTLDLLEAAIENLSFTGSMGNFSFMDLESEPSLTGADLDDEPDDE
jgi:hypothetical protein